MRTSLKVKSTFSSQVLCAAVIAVASLTPPLFSQENNEPELSLKNLLDLDVTTVSKSAEKQSDAPGIISILTRDEIVRFGGTTLRDILERVPGLIGCSGYMVDRSIISARGDQIRSNSGHVLLLINGRPARDIQSGISSELYETFPVNIIERIEVIKGPGSVLYGSDAYSAVINVITEKAEKNSLSATGLAGTGGAYGTSEGVTFRSGDLGIVAAGRYLKKTEWKTPYTALTPDPLNPYVPPHYTTTNVSIPDRGAGAYIGANYKGLSIMAAYNEWTTQYFASGLSNINQYKKSFNNLGYDAKVSENWNMDVNITCTYTELNPAAIAKSASYNLLAEWTNAINLTDKARLIVGGLFNNNDCRETSTEPYILDRLLVDKNMSGYGLYAQVDYRLLESLKLIGGLQANKNEDIKMNAVPRVGLIWYPHSRLSVKTLYSEAFKAPYITELFFDHPTIQGNPNLKPEKVGTIDIGASYQGDKIQAGVNFFQSRQTNIIQMDFSRGVPGTYSNMGKVDFWGVEFEGKWYFDKSLYVNGSVLYQENKDGNGNKNVTPVANLGTKAGISYVWDKGITVGLFDIYQGTISNKFMNALNPDQGAYNLLHLHSDFNINKLFTMEFKPGFSLIINVDNLFDKKRYVYALGDAYPNVMPGNPGRAIYCGLNVTF
jgi:outer membrane receptor for ferrienterochelin and colicins